MHVLQIRSAIESDLPALLALYQSLIPGDAAPTSAAACATLAQFLTYPNSAIFLGETSGQLVTSCTLIVIPNLTRGGSPYALLENVVTRTDHRAKGYGKHILRHATNAAWEAGCYKVMLMTGSTDPATHAFYRAAGFDTTKTAYQIRRISARSSD